MKPYTTDSQTELPAQTKPLDSSLKNSFFVNNSPFTDRHYLLGMAMLTISFGFFLFSPVSSEFGFSLFENFILNYVIAIFYTVWLLAAGKMQFFWKKQKVSYQAHRLLLWVIWLVSCFAFNKSMPIFNPSAPWLSTTIVLSGVTCILFSLSRFLSLFMRKILYFSLGTSTVLWTYYSLYLFWLYPISIPAILFFGLSAHSFIPMILLIAHFKIIIRKWRIFKVSILFGIIAPIVCFVCFYLQWYSVIYKIRYTDNDIVTSPEDDLPRWVKLGQTLGDDWITERMLIGDFMYQMPLSDITFVPRETNFQDLERHDPFVLLASLFSPKTDLSEKERIKLLDVLFDARHYSQERLWSGKTLRTINVVTQARIYPEYRLAYTEKTLTIRNNTQSGRNQQEALYTFYLPEGAVVSSLSLWINDKEEKGFLTSKTKADSAYKTVVNYERRDPSVIHWQEGNVVKVKVFPCTAKENRRFKIGVTSPLRSVANRLIYENIYFQGPSGEDATETIRLDFTTNVTNIHAPFRIGDAEHRKLISRGKYRTSWEVSFDTVSLASTHFSFNGKSYAVKPYRESLEPFQPRNIFLDLNAAWDSEEFEQIYSTLKNRNLYAYDERFIKLTDTNRQAIFKKLQANRYTIFPIQKVPDAATDLLITKGTATSPNLRDLEGSRFGDELKSKSDSIPALKTLNMGNTLSPYFKTLNELRIVRCEAMPIDIIMKLTSNNRFPADPESNTGVNTLRIANAGIVISESDLPTPSLAPDHFLRLFAYNHIMKQLGPHYLNPNDSLAAERHHTLVKEAAQANIVTPVSSLIVLETQADYKRFNIEKSRNSLDNATLKNYGAVPEPHEWLLITLFLLLVSYYTFRSHVR